MKTAVVTCLFPLLFFGCSGDAPVDSNVPADIPADAPAVEVAAEYHAMCGCSIESIGECGNYVEVGGAYVVLEHESLGVMEFCGDKADGAQIKIAGAMTDGKFVATSYERVD